jgi:hypothetical protein
MGRFTSPSLHARAGNCPRDLASRRCPLDLPPIIREALEKWSTSVRSARRQPAGLLLGRSPGLRASVAAQAAACQCSSSGPPRHSRAPGVTVGPKAGAQAPGGAQDASRSARASVPAAAMWAPEEARAPRLRHTQWQSAHAAGHTGAPLPVKSRRAGPVTQPNPHPQPARATEPLTESASGTGA